MSQKNSAAEKATVLKMLDEARFIKNVLGNPRKAIKLCNQILEIDPENRDALLIKAGGLQESMHFQEALALHQQIIEKWPQHWEAYYLAGMNHFSQERDREALEMIDKSVECKEMFDNVIAKAQMLCLWNKEYESWLEKARLMDASRAANFMKHHWVGNMDKLEVTLWDKIKTKLMMKR